MKLKSEWRSFSSESKPVSSWVQLDILSVDLCSNGREVMFAAGIALGLQQDCIAPKRRCRPGPKGPNKELVDAVITMKRRNPSWGCPRIAQQISLAFGIVIDKDVVCRILSVHYRPETGSGGPSWLPHVPLSHPFVERLIGTIRREYLDQVLFWTTADLEQKLLEFKHYYNSHRVHARLGGRFPEPIPDGSRLPLNFDSYRWQTHCRGLYHTPIAA